MAKTHAEADVIGTNTEKAIIIDEALADSDAMAYELDRTDDMLALADYEAKGIEVLDNDTGFFMMCEGGKIDWASHANDAASTNNDRRSALAGRPNTFCVLMLRIRIGVRAVLKFI